jgi:arylsulfatase A-like enzyme
MRGVVLGAVLLSLGCVAAGCGGREQQRPNVLLISIDTLRADKLGAYGNPRPTSPALDRRLAAEGVTFTRALSQSPKTTPSHMTMLTSLYPTVHGVGMWHGDEHAGALRPEVDTLAELMKARGYATVAFTGGGNVHAARGFGQGFDVYEHGKPAEKTIQWLQTHGKEKRFFLFFHTYVVHDPYVHPAKYVRQFNAEYDGPFLDLLEQLAPGGKDKWEDRSRIFWDAVDPADGELVRFVKDLYEAGILRMDESQLTEVLDTLDRQGLARDTLVVFTSDHGEAFLEHGHFLHTDLHHETLHVPLVLRWPGHLPAGQRVDAPVSLIDLMPTILDTIGLPVPGAAQGRSLKPLWSGGTLAPRPIVSEWDGQVAVRDGGFAYIVGRSSEALYDLAKDPGEQQSIVDYAGQALEARREQKANWDRECRTRVAALGPAPEGEPPSEETEKQLRALGYVK